VQNFFGIDYPTALGVVHDLTTQRMQQFQHVAAHELPVVYDDFALSGEAREAMRDYVLDLQNWMAGILHWHQNVDRYKPDFLARRAHRFLPDRSAELPLPLVS
jgi:germacradienol/geosmin synthase